MTEDELSNISGLIYFPSILASRLNPPIIFGSFFLERWLPGLHGKRRALAWLATTVLTLTVFIATLIWAFGIGGCFENCTGKKDDEIGSIVAGIANWIYVLVLFFVCIRKHKNKASQATCSTCNG